MINNDNQECPQCRHVSAADALVCDLCHCVLAKAGMTLTYFPGTSSNNFTEHEQLLSQTSNNTADTLVFDDTTKADEDKDKALVQPSHEKNNGMSNFKIHEVIGQGGMGAVYKAEDLILQRYVALKLFRSQLSTTPNGDQHLLDEARMACKLNHPNIVTIYDIARGQDNNFIIMEWVDGQSIDELLPSNGLPLQEAMEYACQIIDGLACAHENGIIHHDIKPQNIMLNKENRIKILDFGIAELLSLPSKEKAPNNSDKTHADGPGITRLSGFVGTPQYMSPEQVLEQPQDERSDIFSFGIVLYEMLTGQRPFKANNLGELKRVLSKGEYRPIAQLRPDLPASVTTLIEKMLASDISKRWQTSVELASALHKIFDDLTKRKNWWQRRHWLLKTALVLPIVLATGWSFKEIILPPSTDDLIERRLAGATKIAILPFENISGDPLLQIFNDGLVASLNMDLTLAGREQGDGNTWIIPSSEIRRMKDQSVQKVSTKFGVDIILTGSIQHMGSTRSLVLNLLNAKDGRQLKSKQLTIEADRLFQGQNLIRRDVMQLLGWNISSELTKKFNAQKPQFDGAYKEYIHGNGYLYRYDRQKNLTKALEAFQKAIEIDPKYENAYVGLAESKLVQFILTKNREVLDELAVTIHSLRKLNALHPKLNYLGAELAMQKGEYQKAVDLYQLSTETNPLLIVGHLGLAKAYGKQGNIVEAEKVYQVASRKAPNNWKVVFDFGIHYFKNGFYEKALRQFEKLATMSPNNYYGYRNMAAAYYSLGDIENAILLTKKSINLQPSEGAYANLGTMLFYIKQYDEAVSAYTKAVELRDTDYLNWGNLADAYRFSKKHDYISAYDKAAQLAEEAINLNPNDSLAISHSAYYYANLKRVETANKYAMMIGSRNTGLENFVVATAYDLLEQPEKTLYHLNIAVEKNYPIEEILETPLLEKTKSNKLFEKFISQVKKKDKLVSQ